MAGSAYRAGKENKAVVYVTTPGACVHQTHGRLRVMRGKEVLQEVRLLDIERVVVLGGTAGVTSRAATALMEAGIECAFLSTAGKFRGFLAPAAGRGATLRVAQFRAYHDPARRLEVARRIVIRKIKNGDVLLARFARNHPQFDASSERARLARAAASAEEAPGIDLLLGYEGTAAAAYFAAFGRMLGGGFRFTERSRRPPRDPTNALLSFGYALLTSEAVAAVAGAGLEPAVGMLHAPEDGRPALALDLMEPFRSAAVDRLVLHLANNRMLSPEEDFTHDPQNGARLTDAARRTFLCAYEERMTEPFRPNKAADEANLRRCLRQEAHALARCLRDGTAFRPFALP